MKLSDLLNEEKSLTFEEFAEKRYSGAKKISDNAKEKGGAAMLTYHHFVVKLPHYQKAAGGNFDLKKAKKEFKTNLGKLCEMTDDIDMRQTEFQRVMGLVEVLGELIIRFE